MFGWRKRKDGFEWHEYVRTTILVRRRNRRNRVEHAAKAAVGGLKVAGERGAAAGAAGAQALGRGAKAAGHHGVAMSAAGVRAADARLRTGLPKAWHWLESLGRAIGRALILAWAFVCEVTVRVAAMLGALLAPVFAHGWRAAEPLFPKLRKPGVTIVLCLIAGVAFVGSLRRIAVNGVTTSVVVALLIGVVIAASLLAAWLAQGVPAWLATGWRGTRRAAGGAAGVVGRFAPSGAIVSRGAAAVAVVALMMGVGWLLWRAAAALPMPSLAGLSSTTTAEGRAKALSGDTLRVGKTAVHLTGIEAPERDQTCLTRRSRSWQCGASARQALAGLVRRKKLTCELSGSDDRGVALGRCLIGETDVAAELVRDGHVFAAGGFFAPYGSQEDEAREAKAGLWDGEALRPSDYRAERWEAASREAPDGCPIKGNVTRGRHVYVLPWSGEYDRVRVSSRRGERWFCSEDEAITAGFKPAEES
jgi:endonuclease YncB( thermonuclease family)